MESHEKVYFSKLPVEYFMMKQNISADRGISVKKCSLREKLC